MEADSHVISKDSINNFATLISKNFGLNSASFRKTNNDCQYDNKKINIECKQFVES
jgi:hypothetical protein